MPSNPPSPWSVRRIRRGIARRIDPDHLQRPAATSAPEDVQPARAGTTDPDELPQRCQRADFLTHLTTLRREVSATRTQDPQWNHPRRHLGRKLFSYRLAASHGVRTPRILGAWDEPSRIDFDGLPDTFVLKCDGGAAGRAVWPLRRDGAGWTLVDGSESFSTAELSSLLGEQPHWTLPVFAEEFLPAPPGSALPDDVKLYAFYGEIGHVMIRRMPRHRDMSTSLVRYVDADGADLGPVITDRVVDPSLAVPDSLAEMVEISRTLSRAVPLPFVRVDLYDTPDGVVFGELTPGPGGGQTFVRQHAGRLGGLWEAAQSRLELDLAQGRRFDNLAGGTDWHHLPQPGPIKVRPIGVLGD